MNAINIKRGVRLGLVLLVILFFQSCIFDTYNKAPQAKNGILDLREVNFDQQKIIPLKGQWFFSKNTWLDSRKFDTQKSMFLNVPGAWNLPNGKGFGTYQLKILLPQKHKREFAIKMLDISTSYTMYVDTMKLISVGNISSEEKSYKAAYNHVLQKLPLTQDTLVLTIQVANYLNFEGGILTAPEFGLYKSIDNKTLTIKIIGLVVVGSFIAFFFFQMGFGFYRMTKRYHVYLALNCIFYAIHLMCLNERMAYNYIPSWELTIRLEMLMVVLALFSSNQTIQEFFESKTLKVITAINFLVLILFCLIILFAPILIATKILDYIPFYIVFTFIIVNISSIQAILAKKKGSKTLVLFNAIMLLLIIYDNLFFKQHVGGLVLGHLGYFMYGVYLTILLSRQAAATFVEANKLSQELQRLNSSLEEQNVNLEKLIAERTKQLLENEQKTHTLELQSKQRDIEAVKINNQLKHDMSRKMIFELEKIQKSDKDIKVLLKKLIAEIKQQFGLNEKLNILEKQMDEVNSEFHDRLTSRFPNLTKTERELCALIKLNLSNKEISELLKTNPNALNVARSRLRKKLDIPKEMDMEVFIRKI